MAWRFLIGTLVAVGLGGSATIATNGNGTACASLAALTIPNVTVRSAASVAAGPFTPPGAQTALTLPAFCRVEATARPTNDSDIRFEVWIPPADAWNGKFEGVGNGGYSGAINYTSMAAALRRGYATASTDTGHTGDDMKFGQAHPEKLIDWAWRSVHVMTDAAKLMVRSNAGRLPEHSYFEGCSSGGHQALSEAQRFPDDYDGIIAGALANRHIQMHTAGVARSIELARHPERTIPEEKAKLVNDTVMNACDTLKEGFLNNPRECKVDLSKLACSGADSPTCLTAAQMKTVETFYGGLKNSKGELIFSGQAIGNPIPALRGATGSPGGGYDTVRIWGFQDANYDWHTFDLDRDMPIINKKVGFVDAVNPDLRKFKAHGGKLLLYAGWRDTTITPENTVLYYENLVKEMGEQKDFTRLFMVPGMAHCRGGDGPDTFDTIATMEQWREQGVTPAQMMGTNKGSGLTRPLCPYPQYAKYKGTGDLKDAKNWACTQP
jgi:feruloyl esterase